MEVKYLSPPPARTLSLPPPIGLPQGASVLGLARLGSVSSLSAPDTVNLDLPLPLHSMSRLGPLPSVPDGAYSSTMPLLQHMARVELSLLVSGVACLDASPPVSNPLMLEPPLTSRSCTCLGATATALAVTRSGVPPLLRQFAWLGPLSPLCGLSHAGAPLAAPDAANSESPLPPQALI